MGANPSTLALNDHIASAKVVSMELCVQFVWIAFENNPIES